jgi:hypothetical protein
MKLLYIIADATMTAAVGLMLTWVVRYWLGTDMNLMDWLLAVVIWGAVAKSGVRRDEKKRVTAINAAVSVLKGEPRRASNG